MNLNISESEKTPLVISLLEIINEQRKEIETLKNFVDTADISSLNESYAVVGVIIWF